MAKRFTATEKWLDPWFTSLSNSNRMFWVFLLDNCDHAGIWQVNPSLVKLYFGSNFKFPEWPERITKINSEKWFIPKFVEFQYGELDSRNRVHQSVIFRLKKEGAYKALNSPIQGRKDKDNDKDKEYVKPPVAHI